ncbi:hypothetical protein M408DRAFT_29720 [Serendipita vermifera MAFF 305830]|uniref:ubiquitinyl hydrolase 1 n=1 Tax=Serendipita vermifera MAFF 305830 TaxID=933852 RepID=A0A0C3APQ6_SERVB|nr:hypothetical protein M408DRAFT_29720 [Serendipita vermifera MAFF 305830]
MDDRLSAPYHTFTPPGIKNLGETCYMSVALQVLLGIDEVLDMCLTKHSSETCSMASQSGFCAVCAMQPLAFAMIGPGIVAPKQFANIVKCSGLPLSEHRQNDAEEFLMFVLQQMHLSMSATTAMLSVLTTYLDSGVRTRYRIYVRQAPTLQQGIVCTQAQEKLNESTCANCSSTHSMARQSLLHEPPHILALQLVRFENAGKKIRNLVQYSDTMNVQFGPLQNAPVSFHLFAVVCHHGASMDSGHYSCYIRRGERWYHVDDERVKLCEPPINVSDVYLLLYTQNLAAEGLWYPNVDDAGQSGAPGIILPARRLDSTRYTPVIT